MGVIIVLVGTLFISGCGIPQADYDAIQSKNDNLELDNANLALDLDELQDQLTSLQTDLDRASIGATHFSDEDEVVRWFVDYTRSNVSELNSALDSDPVLFAMLVQSAAIKDKHLVSVHIGYTYMSDRYVSLIMPIAFTPMHVYSMCLTEDEVWVCKMDNGRGWRVADFVDWKIMKYSIIGTGYTPVDVIDGFRGG
jgi:outer membrane murein-binding lipoprotein Lpp